MDESYSEVTEQGSSASQMSAAKVMDVIARVPDSDGHAADAVSAYTQVMMEDAPRLLRIPKSECPELQHTCPKSLSDIEGQAVPIERSLYGHPLAELFLEKTVRASSLLELGWRKVPNW